MNLQEIKDYIYRKAIENEYVINGDRLDSVALGLYNRYQKFEALVCPCVFVNPEQKDDKAYMDKMTCPCEDFRKANFCHCNLFRK